MATMMEPSLDSPTGVPDTPTDADDGLYPCKGCGDILEEGKAFELAGNRWHIDCFRCNTCGTLLDSDANLLLLGDGSLICNNCTYSCSACGNKIEDLAILTGQEAFCAQCFKCRNCKKKIENLRYARTSQGIFCMQCHESLMARRRKKSRASGRAPSANSNSSNPTVLDKSLPALPPGAVPPGALAEANSYSPASINSETPTERSPAMRHTVSMKNEDARKHMSPLSFERLDEFKENLGVPDDPTGSRRISNQSSRSNGSHGDDDNYIPVTLDTMARPPGPYRTMSSEARQPRVSTQAGSNERSRDFGDLVAGSAPRSGSLDRGQTSPHIMQQVMPRQNSTERVTGLRRRNGSIKMSSPVFSSSRTSPVDRKPASPSSNDTSEEHFILHEVPKARRRSSGSKRGSKPSSHQASPNMTLAGQTEGSAVRPQETSFDTPATSTAPTRNTSARQRSPLSHNNAQLPFARQEPPQRTDSLERSEKPPSNQAIPRKQLPRNDPPATTTAARGLGLDSHTMDSHSHSHEPQTAPAVAGRSSNDEAFEPPPRSSSRPTPTAGLSSAAMNSQAASKHDFTSPREAPQPPPIRHKPGESVSSIQSETFITRDGGTPTNHGTAFYNEGTEDEFGRMGSEDGMDHGMFRKVSKVMRHGRSYSDKGSPRFTKGSRNGSIDISSPMIGANEANEDTTQLRNKLRFSQQRIMELESEKNTLQEQVNGAENIRQVNTELREKRSTMTFLDTQREMIMRELETMTEQLEKAKNTKGPLDIEAIKSEALREFANQLQRLKESVSGQIESLMEQKNKLTDEITNLIQMKDKGFQEYESVHAKNQQLREHNAQLVASIQGIYRDQKQAPNNALGISTGITTAIYNGAAKHRQDSVGATLADENSQDFKSQLSLDRSNASQFSGDTEVTGEPARFIDGPRVVDMRKGQPKKFSWKKGSENVAKNVKKGFKGAFASGPASSQSSLREESFSDPVPYGQLQAGEAPTIGDRPVGQRNGIETQRQPSSQPFGFLNKPGNNSSRSTSQSALVGSAPADTLFGSDLTARCEYEGRVIPGIIARCIDEVEARGMDVEGIYRKSGSYSQVKAVSQGFEKDHKFDISDEDLDIHAVTSALKQYLRKLPMPLITHEAYDEMIGTANAAQDQSERVLIEGCSRAVGILPEHHKNTLEYLIGHLSRVMERERENKMTSTNIAVVFAPTIMRPQSVDREMADMEAQRRAVQCLLVNYRNIFGL